MTAPTTWNSSSSASSRIFTGGIFACATRVSRYQTRTDVARGRGVHARDPFYVRFEDEGKARELATIASLIETGKLNAVDPQTYLTATLTAIDKLLPWKEITDFDFDDGPLKMRWNWQHHRTQDAPTEYLCP
ncbi:hypothetical protein GFL21_13785 [Rhizobium anhuiense]|nr:hypothetical protein [Rhizobium anhuiense]